MIIHIKTAFYIFIFLFDKQQYHVCHFNVDTIIRLSVILQYLRFLCPLRYIKKKNTSTANVRGRKSMVPNQISTFQQYFTHSFNKVLRNVIMTWAWNISRHFLWRSWRGTGDVVNSRKTGTAKWPNYGGTGLLFPTGTHQMAMAMIFSYQTGGDIMLRNCIHLLTPGCVQCTVCLSELQYTS